MVHFFKAKHCVLNLYQSTTSHRHYFDSLVPEICNCDVQLWYEVNRMTWLIISRRPICLRKRVLSKHVTPKVYQTERLIHHNDNDSTDYMAHLNVVHMMVIKLYRILWLQTITDWYVEEIPIILFKVFIRVSIISSSLGLGFYTILSWRIAHVTQSHPNKLRLRSQCCELIRAADWLLDFREQRR